MAATDEQLSRTDVVILEQLDRGDPVSTVAERMGLTPTVVGRRLVSLREHFEVTSTRAAVAAARDSGLI
jgi:DNA-binding NarL/FixJ family response regulator